MEIEVFACHDPAPPMDGATWEKLRHSDPKRCGQIAEFAFAHKAATLGFLVAKPYGDSEPYDFIVSSAPDQRLWRVQVKSTASRRGYRYFINVTRSNTRNASRSYTPEQIDFFAILIVPLALWYVIPIRELGPAGKIAFYPDRVKSRGRLECFCEAWHLMRVR